MKFYEKYPELKNRADLERVLSGSVYATMLLEGQFVDLGRIRQIVASVLQEHESKEGQFFLNKA